ncbi:putative leader peptide [Streptomyces physcomitrii]
MRCTQSRSHHRGQADLTKRRAVDLCRVAAMLCRTF